MMRIIKRGTKGAKQASCNECGSVFEYFPGHRKFSYRYPQQSGSYVTCPVCARFVFLLYDKDKPKKGK